MRNWSSMAVPTPLKDYISPKAGELDMSVNEFLLRCILYGLENLDKVDMQTRTSLLLKKHNI